MRYKLHIWHAYSNNDGFSNDIKVNDLLTLTLTYMLKIAFSNSVAAGGKVFHKHIDFSNLLYTSCSGKCREHTGVIMSVPYRS